MKTDFNRAVLIFCLAFILALISGAAYGEDPTPVNKEDSLRKKLIEVLDEMNIPKEPPKPKEETVTVTPVSGTPVQDAQQKKPVNISLDFRNAPVKEVITELSRQAGVNVTYAELEQQPHVTVLYKGNNIEEAIKAVMKSGGLAYVREGDLYIVSEFESKTFDIAIMYESSFILGSSSGGAGTSSSSSGVSSVSSGSSTSASGGTLSSVGDSTMNIEGGDFKAFVTRIVERIEKVKSSKGKISYLPSGVLYVRDYPYIIRDIESMFSMDEEKRQEIDLKVTILRVDYNKDHAYGVDWSKVFSGGFNLFGLKDINLNLNFANMVSGGNVGSLTFTNADKSFNGLVNVVGAYGDIKIVHNWQTRAVVGSVLPFELTQLAWYSQGSTIQIINNQTITTPIINNREVGIRIRLMPVAHNGKFLVNSFIELSTIVGSQHVAGEDLPNISKNMVSVPINLGKDEMATISGFKLTSEEKQKVGIPFLSKIPILNLLFGYQEAQDRTSELVVVVSVGK